MQIYCGLSEIDITPKVGLSIPGQLYDRKSVGVREPLYVKAMVIENAGIKAAFLSADMLHAEKKDVLSIRELTEQMTGIPGKNIMVTAIHNHTAIPCSDTPACRRDERYMETFVQSASRCIMQAWESRMPAVIRCAFGTEEEISFNRRFFMKDGSVRMNPGVGNKDIVKPTGHIDPDVQILRIDDPGGNPFGFLVNFACHCDSVRGTDLSGDYPGEIARMLKLVYGENLVTLFFPGACGNINHIDCTGHFPVSSGHYLKMGKILAGEVIKVSEKASELEYTKISNNSGILDVVTEQFTVETRSPACDEIERSNQSLLDGGLKSVERVFASELLKVAEIGTEKADLEIQVIRIGSAVIIGLPAEVFTELGLEIKRRSPFKFTIVNSCTNGRNGYIATKEAYGQGGYETRITRFNRLTADAGEILVSSALALINRLI